MQKVDFSKKGYFALSPIESTIDENGESKKLADVGDEIHSIEHIVDEKGGHVGFEFAVNNQIVKKKSDLGRMFMVDCEHPGCEEIVRTMKKYHDLMAEAGELLRSVTRAGLPTFVKYFQAERVKQGSSESLGFRTGTSNV